MYTIKATDPHNYKIDINFPSPEYIDKYDKLPTETDAYWDTLDKLKDYLPAFEADITLLTRSNQKARLEYAGFRNIICIDDYQAGDRWTLDNGNYMQLENTTNYLIQWYYADGSRVSGDTGNLSHPIQDNYVYFFMEVYPEVLAQDLTNRFHDVAPETSSLQNRNFNRLREYFAIWSPSDYPPRYKTFIYSFTNTQGCILAPPITQNMRLNSWNNLYKGIEIESDKYKDNPDGETGTGGGDGDFDRDSDNIDHPGLPTTSAVDTGFITIYNPSLAELQNLASYMWSGPFDLNAFKKIFADPMEAILGLSMIPVTVPNAGQQNVKVGNIDTGIMMNRAASQFVTVDCGSLNIKTGCDNTYFDYSPFSKAFIYLPFIGTHAIDIDDVVKHNVSIKYNVDILSGGCIATIKCGNSVKYDFQGSCSTEIPITGQSFAQMYNGIINIGAQIGQMVGTGGMSGGLAAADIAATAVNSLKPDIERSGAIGAAGGLLGRETPAIIIHNPRLATPKDQNKYLGYPSFITTRIGSLSGYTIMESVRLEKMSATQEEKSEIEALLKSGVIV